MQMFAIKITTPPGAYGKESLNNEIKRTIIEEGHFTEATCPFTIQPKISTVGSMIDFSAIFNGS